MARTRKKTRAGATSRTKARVRTKAPRPTTARVSTQRARTRAGAATVHSTGGGGRTRSAPASRARGRAADSLRVTLDLRDVAGRPISDPETFFTFRTLSDNRQIGDQLALSLSGAPAVFDLPAAHDVAMCEIDPRRYRFVRSPVFFRSPGTPVVKQSRLFRDPGAWTPKFTTWTALPAAFSELKRVLALSPRVTLFNGVESIGDLLVKDAYDGLSDGTIVLAKAALLNTYSRLNGTTEPVAGVRTWFSYVTRILAIGQERFLGFVEPEMEARVREIHEHIDQFSGDYERTPSENHRGNVPAALRGRITRMISIKSTHRKGNFQLTLSHLTGPEEVFLDADLDESGDLLGHTLDLLKHKFTGGTHPHDIHELLVYQAGPSDPLDLGYQLV